MNASRLKEIQEKLDVYKLIDSEHKGYDMCGEYEYCVFCKKRNKYPCATAYVRYEKEIVKEFVDICERDIM